ncbi:hypothetical protein CC78DRAFT_538638 [Lojkania enalia]|uniref:Uncharacterized protein n=1 Tax=Lojkania enalia TaxID=147567 RepID=A0A9P4NCZ7_9PLEO|nr:hypothetical protein CC78DRAFT_538638 [Didymosphaeria enalia]
MEGAEVVKKRGRPKKVPVEEVVEEAKIKGTRKASTKATTKVSAKTTAKATVASKPTKSLKAKEDTKKVEVKAALAKTAKPASTTPSTSKILREVAVKGTLKISPQSKPPATPESKPAAPIQFSQPSPTTLSTATPPSLTSVSPSTSPKPRITTVPLPANPINPSAPPAARPKPPTRIPHASPKPPSATKSPPSPPFAKTEASPNPQPAREPPNPNTPLPQKYKPAARRVTAIMVGLPILLVTSWELYTRYWKWARLTGLACRHTIPTRYPQSEIPRHLNVTFHKFHNWSDESKRLWYISSPYVPFAD